MRSKRQRDWQPLARLSMRDKSVHLAELVKYRITMMILFIIKDGIIIIYRSGCVDVRDSTERISELIDNSIVCLLVGLVLEP